MATPQVNKVWKQFTYSISQAMSGSQVLTLSFDVEYSDWTHGWFSIVNTGTVLAPFPKVGGLCYFTDAESEAWGIGEDHVSGSVVDYNNVTYTLAYGFRVWGNESETNIPITTKFGSSSDIRINSFFLNGTNLDIEFENRNAGAQTLEAHIKIQCFGDYKKS